MKYNFTELPPREGSSAVKTCSSRIKESLGVNYYPDSIPMWIADMDFVVAPQIIEAVKHRADLATFGYSNISEQYHHAVIEWFAHRHSMHFTPDEILFSSGTVPATRNIIRTFTAEGDGVIIQPPVYYPFGRVTEENNRKVVENNLLVDADNNYSIDFEDFERKCADPRNKLFIFCNPHNPIGQIWDRETAQRLLDICRAHDVIFFSDEVHADILRKDALFTSSLNLDHTEDIIVATAVNKTFNLAGLHITNLIIKNEAMRQRLDAFVGGAAISPFAEAAAIAAYTQCQSWVDEMNDVLDENLEYTKAYLAENMPKVKFNLPQATYLVWLDMRGYGLEEHELISLCAEKAHVIVEGGSMFGPSGRGFIRMNIACPKEVLKEALRRLSETFA